MNKQTIINLANQALGDPPYPDPRFPPSPYYRFLRRLAAAMQPMTSVELGVCGGGGSFHLALGWPLGVVIGVDLTEGEYKQNFDFIYGAVNNFQLWLGDSVELAREIYQTYHEIDILFIDTIHTYERTLAEFNAYRPYLADPAVVILDDLHRDGMIGAFNAIPGREHILLPDLHPGQTEGGFGVILI